MRKFITGLALSMAALPLSALELPDSVYHYNTEASVSLSSGAHTPFWLVNNRFGLSSIEKSNGYIRAGIFKDFEYDSRFSWDFGVDLAGAYNFTSSFIVQQLYGGVRYRSLSLTAGAQEWTNGIVSEELSSGDMLFSQNARPIPQVRLAMDNYQPVPYTNKWLSIKGYISMGMYTDGRWQEKHTGPEGDYVKNLLFHSKGGFLRIGDPDRHTVTVEGGLEMGAQFGGTLYRTSPVTGEREVIRFPHGLKEMCKILLPMGGGNYEDSNLIGEELNCLGNHTGQWSLAVNWTPKNTDWRIRTYYEHYFEDHSMMFFDHAWKDMLLGGEITFPRNPVITSFVYEYLITKDQSGAVYWDYTPEVPSQISGADNYYNHYLYPGWEHWGMGMGNPLVISPIYNADGSLRFAHNRIKGHHFGWKGNPHPDLGYRVLMTYTRSWGIYHKPVRNVLHNFNALLEVTYRPHQLPGWTGRIGVAADGGRLLGKSFGAMITISKSGWL